MPFKLCIIQAMYDCYHYAPVGLVLGIFVHDGLASGISITDSFGESYCSVSWERAIVSPIPFQENKNKAENSLSLCLCDILKISLSFSGFLVWNSLPHRLRHAMEIKAFKRKAF